VPLPEAYRSLSRPSSPVGTKASTVCPSKLDSMFEISSLEGRPALQPSFPCNSPARSLTDRTGFAVKIDVFGNQNIFKDRKNSSRDVTPASRIAPCCNFLQSIKSYFSPYGCQRADFSLQFVRNKRRFTENGLPSRSPSQRERGRAKAGGPDRTRTYDPRLITAVL
jgi:hypothetical protein